MGSEVKNRKNKNSLHRISRRKSKDTWTTDENDSETRLSNEVSDISKNNLCSENLPDRATCERDEGDGESVPEHDVIEDIKLIANRSAELKKPQKKPLKINVEIDVISALLFAVAVVTRFYKLEEPRNIVFDELHYGKYVSLYMKRTFFFDAHPPFGKQLIAAVAYLAGFDGNFKFDSIGSPYKEAVPLFALRLVPAACGSLLIPATYHFMLELGCKQWTAALAAFLVLCDNAILTQSRFILMESMLLLFTLYGMLCVLRFRKLHDRMYCWQWWFWLALSSVSLTLALW